MTLGGKVFLIKAIKNTWFGDSDLLILNRSVMYYLLLTEYEFISSLGSYIIRGNIQTIVSKIMTLTTGPPPPLKGNFPLNELPY